ncbi:hypothetical protein ACH5RR_038856 [Cinchona calisaya]|uniref:Uncharacterized protein n=1 Tax=Cinchona calisaya TaxID=153742 RepID=A0ABD2XXW6_9GENT
MPLYSFGMAAEFAHDILEDLESEGNHASQDSYMSLLTAYYNREMFEEGDALLEQIRITCMLTNLPDEMDVSKNCLELENKITLNFEDPANCFDFWPSNVWSSSSGM